MHKKKSFVFIIIALIVLAGIIGIYMQVNPANSPIVPKCLFKTLTGYDCPSCGGQRALHAILKGEIGRAFMLNPFLFIAMPFLVAVAFSSFSDSKFAKRLKPIVQSTTAIAIYLFVYIAWWIIRNTPLWSY